MSRKPADKNVCATSKLEMHLETPTSSPAIVELAQKNRIRLSAVLEQFYLPPRYNNGERIAFGVAENEPPPWL